MWSVKCVQSCACRKRASHTRQIFTKCGTCHAKGDSQDAPRLPRNLHLVTTSLRPDNTIRKNTQHDTSEVLRLPRKMTMDTAKVQRLARKLQLIFCKRCKSIAPATKNDFQRFCRHVRMSGNATPATQNESQPALTPSTRKTLAASPTDTATAKENQSIKTRHVGASKRAYRARFPPVFKLSL